MKEKQVSDKETFVQHFEPVYMYPDGHSKKIDPSRVYVQVCEDDDDRWPCFDAKKLPMLPLAFYGEIWHEGWDIPTRYAIDAIGHAWMDNAHGHPMSSVEPRELVFCEETEARQLAMAQRLGFPIEEACCRSCGGTGKVMRPKR